MNINPYAPPAVIPEPSWPWRLRATAQELYRILLLAPLVGAALGGLFNIINGYISPELFSRRMGWDDFIHLRSILQGMLEGSVYGLGNAILFLIVAALFSRNPIPQSLVYQLLVRIALLVTCCWAFMGIAYLAIVHWGPALVVVPDAFWMSVSSVYGYAWVSGSIKGAVYGSPLCTLIGIALLIRHQRRSSKLELTATAEYQ